MRVVVVITAAVTAAALVAGGTPESVITAAITWIWLWWIALKT